MWIIGALFLGAYLVLALMRMPYPFDLELEGQMISEVQRVLDGLPVYSRPNLDYSAVMYNPLYFYASAPLAALVGNSYFSERLSPSSAP